MKAILEFDLDSVDDSLSHLRCISAVKMVYVLSDIRNEIRGLLRDERLSFDDIKRIRKFENIFYKVLDEQGINIDELMDEV